MTSKDKLRTSDMTHIALFAVLLAVCSWLVIPAPIPFTLQTFAVFFALLTLGGKHGFICIVIYLLMGIVGLPVFSGFQGGFGTLLGPSGGYLLGFAVAAILFRLLTARRAAVSRSRKIAGCLTGLLGCYIFGTAWYMYLYGGKGSLWSTLVVCVFPFVIPDLIKLALAALLSRQLNRHLPNMSAKQLH